MRKEENKQIANLRLPPFSLLLFCLQTVPFSIQSFQPLLFRCFSPPFQFLFSLLCQSQCFLRGQILYFTDRLYDQWEAMQLPIRSFLLMYKVEEFFNIEIEIFLEITVYR